MMRIQSNLIEGTIDNSIPGRVTGNLLCCRYGKRAQRFKLYLRGDFSDRPGAMIRIHNPCPIDRNVVLNRGESYLDGFRTIQRGRVGLMTTGASLGPWTLKLAQLDTAKYEELWDQIGLEGQERERRRSLLARHFHRLIKQKKPFYPGSKTYPFFEWYTSENGQAIMELNPHQVEVISQSKARERTRDRHSKAGGRARAPLTYPKSSEAYCVPHGELVSSIWRVN